MHNNGSCVKPDGCGTEYITAAVTGECVPSCVLLGGGGGGVGQCTGLCTEDTSLGLCTVSCEVDNHHTGATQSQGASVGWGCALKDCVARIPNASVVLPCGGECFYTEGEEGGSFAGASGSGTCDETCPNSDLYDLQAATGLCLRRECSAIRLALCRTAPWCVETEDVVPLCRSTCSNPELYEVSSETDPTQPSFSKCVLKYIPCQKRKPAKGSCASKLDALPNSCISERGVCGCNETKFLTTDSAGNCELIACGGGRNPAKNNGSCSSTYDGKSNVCYSYYFADLLTKHYADYYATYYATLYAGDPNNNSQPEYYTYLYNYYKNFYAVSFTSLFTSCTSVCPAKSAVNNYTRSCDLKI